MRSSTALVAVTLLAVAGCRPALAAPERPARWGPAAVELVDEAGSTLPTFEHRGRTYVLGVKGQRYLLRFRNATGRRVEVVASVDGRDVVDGRPASSAKRGYLVEPYGVVTIDGFRLAEVSVAAFRFGAVSRSYAARMGDARDVGVVGVAVFPERGPPSAPPLVTPDSRVRDGASAAPAEKSRADGAAPPSGAASAAPARPGLGTEFGEEHRSLVERAPFARESARPAAVLTVRYDDRDGLIALGIDVDRRWRARADERTRREDADPFRRERFAEPPPDWRPAP
ncbi:MAG: hypothetical protein ACJ79R_05900 [Anaeromyxobacteraceae bacterium]